MFLKTIGPNGTRITVDSWKAGSRKGRTPYFGGLGFGRLLGCLFEKHENWKWHQKPTFYKSSALGPSKNGPGERFWKNIEKLWKNYRKINCFWWSKTIAKYCKKPILLLISGHSKRQWKNDAKGDLKSHVFCQKWRHGPPSFDLSYYFWRFGAMPKNLHFWTPSRWTKKSNKSTLGAPRAKKSTPGSSEIPTPRRARGVEGGTAGMLLY